MLQQHMVLDKRYYSHHHKVWKQYGTSDKRCRRFLSYSITPLIVLLRGNSQYSVTTAIPFLQRQRALAASLLGTCLTPDFIALLNFCLTPGKDKGPLSRGQLHWAFPVHDHNTVVSGMTGDQSGQRYDLPTNLNCTGWSQLHTNI